MSDDDSRMTFTEHLGELRNRIIYSAIALVIGVIFCYIFADAVYKIVARPLLPPEETLDIRISDKTVDEEPPPVEKEEDSSEREIVWVTLTPIEWLLVKVKLSAYGGLLLALPYILYQISAFIIPGLKPKEVRAVQIIVFFCSLLAIGGVATAYFAIMPFVLPYLMAWTPEGVETQLHMSPTITMILKFYLGFAVAFQFPMVVQVLVFMGLLTPTSLKKYRRVAFVGIAMLSALLTPPDPTTMIMMGLPLVLLYEVSIWASYIVHKCTRKSSQEAA